MLKRLATAVVLGAAFAGTALAYQCPLLIKQLNDAVAAMNPADSKVQRGQVLIAEAKKLHDSGRHAESIATAKKAASVLGLQLKVAGMAPAQEEQVRAAEEKIGK